MSDLLRQIICPTCGRTIVRYNPAKTYGKYTDPEDKVDYLQDFLARVYDVDRNYFAIEREGGRGGLANITQLTPEDWPEGFRLIKEALLRSLYHYYSNGWITWTDIIEYFQAQKQNRGSE